MVNRGRAPRIFTGKGSGPDGQLCLLGWNVMTLVSVQNAVSLPQ